MFLLLGLGTGATYAGLGMGLVVAYRGSGVINFAHGAFAMYTTLFFIELREKGDMVFPWAGFPARFHVMDDPSTPVAFVAAVLLGAAIGLVAYLLVFRPLRHSPPLARVVASVGVMLTLQALAVLRFGTGTKTSKPLFPNDAVEILGTPVPRDRLYLAAMVLVLALVLWLLYHRTLFGLTTQASATNERVATLLGYSSDRVAALNWVLAAVIAALTGILISPITSVNATNFTLFVVPALAAALVGRLMSFWATAIAGLALGMSQSVVILLQRESWFPDWLQAGVREGLPFLAIIVVLFFLGDRLPVRGEIMSGRLPVAVRPKHRLIPVLIAVPVVLVLLFWFDGLFRFGLIHSMVLALLMLSLVVLVGFAGQISLGQAALAGVAGFSLARFGDGMGIPFPIAPALAIVVATVVGLLVGLPALRIRGVQLAVVTIAGAVAIQEILFKNDSFTGGIKGSTVAPPEIAGIDLSVSGGGTFPRIAFGVFVLVVLVAVSLAVVNLRLGPTGFRLLAVRSNERAAAALGVNVSATKLLAFGLSSFIAAIGGVMLGYERQQLSFGSFDVFVGVTILAFAYLGGIASVSGALVGAALVSGGFMATVLEEWIGFPSEYQLLVGGLGLCLTAVLNPEGISGGIRLAREQARAKKAARVEADDIDLSDGEAEATRRPLPPRTGEPHVPGPPLLEVAGLSVAYGGVRALDNFDFVVRQGTLTGLIGPNGAGKTTCIDALTGFVPHATGEVTFDGSRLDGSAAHTVARRGLVRTFQAVELFDELTIAENLAVAADRPRWWTPAVDLVWPTRDTGTQHAIDRALELLDVADLADKYPGELSNGQRRLVGVARALAAEPQLLLLDEPAAGLDSAESLDLGRRLQHLVDNGVTVFLIDHDMSLVLNVCDELYVLDFGNCIASGPPEMIKQDPAVIAAYLGTDEGEAAEVTGQ